LKWGAIALCFVFVLGFSGCGEDTAVSLDRNTLVLGVGKSDTLKATVSPADAEVTWTSEPSGVVTVENKAESGEVEVTGVTVGDATITVITAAGKKTAKCEVSVKPVLGGTPDDPAPVATGELVSDLTPAEKSIKQKFVGSAGKMGLEGVEAAFLELSAFIKGNGLTNGKTQNVIQLGDYIDLDGGLLVHSYNNAGAFFSESDIHWGENLTLTNNDLTESDQPVSMGRMMRLIVVGINSFQPKSSSPKYAYQGTDTPPPHVVFQFQHAPVTRPMNTSGGNADGYPASEMRKYLTPVEDVPGSGNFLAGLVEAGLPEAVLWGPSRLMATNGTQGTPIADLLWLPTEREMFGEQEQTNSVVAVETETTQARLEYYTNNVFRMKLSKDCDGYPSATKTQTYWLASMFGGEGDPTDFCASKSGASNHTLAGNANGVAPAFCVQSWIQSQP
jgi:hypothetical protein